MYVGLFSCHGLFPLYATLFSISNPSTKRNTLLPSGAQLSLMENHVPLPLSLDLDTISMNPSPPSASTLPTIPPLLNPNLVQDYSSLQLSNVEMDWINSLLFGPTIQKPSSSVLQDNPLSLTSRVSTDVGDHRNDDGSSGTGGSRGNNGKVIGRTRKLVPQRVSFHTKSVDDVLDDGYRWRKYGQKAVKNSSHPRSYYRCTHHTCNVKKQIQRLATDSRIVVTTYEGRHNHPCEKLMETLAPLLKQLQFLTRF